ncbi:5'-nucleotidase-like isoform X1, partial [Leptotrombidium deliense]
KEINELKTKGVNIFIALGHSGFDVDKKIAEKVPEVDIVVGGHSNTFLWTGPQPSDEKPVDTYPVVIKHNDGRMSLVVQAFAFSKYLGFLNVIFDEKGDVLKYSGQPILLDHTVPGDPEIQEFLAPKAASIKAKYDSPIGSTAVMLDGDCRRHECNLGNLITDSMVYAVLNASRNKPENGWSEYPAAFLSGGVIRASIDEVRKKGNVTIRDVLRVLPFENEIVGLTLPGALLKQVFEHSVFRITPTSKAFAGEFLQISGFKVKYDLSKPVGEKVQLLEIRCGEDCRVPKFEAINYSKTYKILTTDYLAKGGDLYSMLTNVEHFKFQMSLSQKVIDYINDHSPIATSLEIRSEFISDRRG